MSRIVPYLPGEEKSIEEWREIATGSDIQFLTLPSLLRADSPIEIPKGSVYVFADTRIYLTDGHIGQVVPGDATLQNGFFPLPDERKIPILRPQFLTQAPADFVQELFDTEMDVRDIYQLLGELFSKDRILIEVDRETQRRECRQRFNRAYLEFNDTDLNILCAGRGINLKSLAYRLLE